ncbi:hypothetical protein A2U01_0007703, partial [Trifolium medium]|nr:hypothetical protein [Trifolium medium]
FPEPTQLPEALPARRANNPAHRAKDRSYPENSVSCFQGYHNRTDAKDFKERLNRFKKL